jgi:glycosyltransferase involved in cell wall biosynthesis
MKIVKVIGSLDFGGIEKVFEITARYYRGAKTDIVFLCLGHGGAAEKAIRALGYRVIVWDAPFRIPRLALIFRLRAFFRSEKPEVVHTTGAEANFHGMIAARLSRVPIRIAEEIGMPAHSSTARRIFKMVYRQAGAVIAVAGLVKDYLVDSGEVDAARVSVIYNPVDVAAFTAAHPLGDDGFRVVSVCRLDPIKNLGLLIRGIAAACNSGKRVELWLIGDGPSRKELEALVAELGLQDKVVFWGFQAAPAPFLAQASLFVLPSLSEGIPLSVAEAMLTGTPCLMTRVGGGPEFIREGENGWLLDPLDQAGFNQLLEHIIHLPAETRHEVGQRGLQTAMERFQPEHYLKNVWQLYGKNQDITLP